MALYDLKELIFPSKLTKYPAKLISSRGVFELVEDGGGARQVAKTLNERRHSTAHAGLLIHT